MPVPAPSFAAAQGAAGPDAGAPDDGALLVASLEALAGREGEIVERFYALFFERDPEARALFGEHSIGEREEMVRETLASVLAHAEDAPWLLDHLAALGRSHAEYGVEGRSYPVFVAAMLDTIESLATAHFDPATRGAWERALARISGVMQRAGDRHGGGG